MPTRRGSALWLLLCASCTSKDDTVPTASGASTVATEASARPSASVRGAGSGELAAASSSLGLGTIGPGPGRAVKPAPKPLSRARMGAISVSGTLPPEVIQRIVRQHFAKLAVCYDKGLAANATLEGRVMMTFEIQADGSVKDAQSGGDLPSQAVLACFSKIFGAFTFPQPESGVVKVSLPIGLSPSDKRLGGKAIAEARQPELEKALTGAGCTDLSASELTGGQGVLVYAVNRGGKPFKITFAPASSETDALSQDDIDRLAVNAVAQGTFFLAVEGEDSVASKALLDALLK
ncbi:MAG: AgmX/PglI C-terminal domain-containing protein [Polyangiaceae bacterium]|nr:AgmX/PglI C-terminal domain-containing protein [Polyangiaceae bacterium]